MNTIKYHIAPLLTAVLLLSACVKEELTVNNSDIQVVAGFATTRTTFVEDNGTTHVIWDIGDDIDAAYDEGVTGIFSINRVAVPYKEARLRAKSDMKLTMDNILRFMKSMK